MVTGRLCTAWTADPENIRNTILAMRRMARLGRMSERALRELEVNGRCRRAPILYKAGNGRSYNATVNMEFLEPFQEVSRGEIPGYGGHGMTYSDPIHEHYVTTVMVYLSGDQLLFRPGLDPLVQPVPVRSEIASLSLRGKTDTVRFYPYNTNSLSVNSRSSARMIERLLAKRVASIVVDATDGYETVRSVELQRSLTEWLMEDGHASSWVRNIRDVASVTRVMSR